MLTLANCDSRGLTDIVKFQHPARKRQTLIFAAGALGNKNLEQDLGSAELSTFYDGMVAAGLLDKNPYWPEHGRK